MVDGRDALRMTVYLDTHDRWQRVPAYVELVRRARAAGISGATVLRGIGGFGPRSDPHRSGPFSPASRAPIIVMMVDVADQIQRFLAEVGDLLIGKLVTLEPVRLFVPLSVREGRRADQ